ncbi:aldehyde dehydrogenase family protein [Gordonia sp. HNM0687]|uniref:Aldehyde dehydrogenase family protein n=1 Tax=Gordonia mangrovi TaxID=2665643 RepID=A0A6L7GUA7_9ACTN|nr:aldehyde dehydrogenase family protein [Gordonia mangrovi]
MPWTGRFDQLFINGEWVDPVGDQRIDVISPVTERVVASVAEAGREDVDRAVAAARAAFDRGPWATASLEHRLEVMHRFRALYADSADTLSALITHEMGCPISMSPVIQTGTPLAILDAYLELALEYPFRTIRRSAKGGALVTKEPIGVVAAVVPWNVPQSVLMMKLAPALLTGCSIVIKPSPETPLDAYLVSELLQEAGIPPGVVNMLPAGREGSEYLATHPDVDKVAFTGSTAVGRHLASVCGQDLKRLTLELGGKSAAIFLDDADLDSAVESLRYLSLRNSGQVCSLKTRLVVPQGLKDEVLDRLTALIESMPVGDPTHPVTQIGPMVTQRHRGVVEGYIASGREQGATVVAGGGRPDIDRGWFVEPTIFADVDPDMRIAQEEIFGPVLAVLTYRDEDEALAIANNSDYGLNGAVFTTDIDRGLAIASRIRTGTVELNGNPSGFHAPIGGFKQSGLGREAGLEGFDSYVEPRAIGLPADYLSTLTGETTK